MERMSVHHTEGPTTAPAQPPATGACDGPSAGDDLAASDGAAASEPDLAAEIRTLRDAIATRTIIGQATGLLAAQLDISTPMAWRVMRRLSNETNIKLRDIARALVDAHDGRRPAGDADVARAISAALGAALAAAQAEGDAEPAGDDAGRPVQTWV
jgi:hypothetical protein